MVIKQRKPQTLAGGVIFYVDDCEVRGLSPRTIEGKKCSLQAFEVWCQSMGVSKIAQVDLEVIEAYRAHLARYRQPGNGKPLEKATIRNRLTAVKVFFQRLYVRGVIGANRLQLMELPKVPRQLPKGYLDEEELEAVLQQSLLSGKCGIRDRAMMGVWYATGIRRMELANLTVDDIDMKAGVLTVYKGKGEKDRRVPISQGSCTWVELYLKHVRPKLQRLHSGPELFIDDHGRKFRPQQLSRMVALYVRRAGIRKPGACNLFRHSTATLMLENGADIRHIQSMLGHADISTTQIYTHVAINKLKEVYLKTHPAARR